MGEARKRNTNWVGVEGERGKGRGRGGSTCKRKGRGGERHQLSEGWRPGRRYKVGGAKEWRLGTPVDCEEETTHKLAGKR